jgi:hypothetical protein
MKTENKPGNRQRWIFIPLILVAAALLAPSLWKVINSVVIEPAFYYWWIVKRLIQLAPEIYYWYFWIGGMGLVTLFSIWRYFRRKRKPDHKQFRPEGKLQSLAKSLSKVDKSHYTKWLIANRLAMTTLDIIQHSSGLEETNTYKFPEAGWDAPADIRTYLEAGLDNAHMSLSSKRKWFKPKDTSPLDTDINQVINYIESQMEKS